MTRIALLPIVATLGLCQMALAKTPAFEKIKLEAGEELFAADATAPTPRARAMVPFWKASSVAGQVGRGL